jgi:para-aminobenzoate synthetase component I
LVTRHILTVPIDDAAAWKRRLLALVSEDTHGILLDSNTRAEGWDCLAAYGWVQGVQAQAGQAFSALKDFQSNTPDWLFGYLAYDLKNEVEKGLYSALPDGLGLPDLFFFQPDVVCTLSDGMLTIACLLSDPKDVLKRLGAVVFSETTVESPPVVLRAQMPKSEYLEAVERLKAHIVEGDVYEVNLCQAFFAENAHWDVPATFTALNARAKSPFSAFFRVENRYLLSASPERFACKQGRILTSQPIKGTRRRSADPVEDAELYDDLRTHQKDRAEHVMIVDLVRNDLARCCRAGTVRVEDLFSIHSFETVYQMISTVRGLLRDDVDAVDALRLLFPMGSMTGAPKVMAMQLIEQYERSRRGLYSGAVGYFTPTGDFDFNVVIRSILHDRDTGYTSASVGGAIVYDSDPDQEYQECLVKLTAVLSLENWSLETDA